MWDLAWPIHWRMQLLRRREVGSARERWHGKPRWQRRIIHKRHRKRLCLTLQDYYSGSLKPLAMCKEYVAQSMIKGNFEHPGWKGDYVDPPALQFEIARSFAQMKWRGSLYRILGSTFNKSPRLSKLSCNSYWSAALLTHHLPSYKLAHRFECLHSWKRSENS